MMVVVSFATPVYLRDLLQGQRAHLSRE